MKGISGAAVAVIALWLAAVLQVSLAGRLQLGTGAPDFGLIVLSGLGLFYGSKGDLALGFGAGWVVGALEGVNLTLFVLSRCIVAFLLGRLLLLGIQRSPFTAAAVGAGGTILAQLLLLFFGAHHGALASYLGGTLVTSMYDGVIAALVFLLVDRFASPRRQNLF